MASFVYPTLEQALVLHDLVIGRFGGAPGIRDRAALQSALSRPQSGYYESLTEEAAALMHSLAMNHPCIDGNKRMAFALTAIFLRMNGYRLTNSADAGEQFVIGEVIIAHSDLQAIRLWLEQHMQPVA
ncbi:MAG: type II toxin-antitoxin system death-on-curing family toxin [Polyangiaceae bacterium]